MKKFILMILVGIVCVPTTKAACPYKHKPWCCNPSALRPTIYVVTDSALQNKQGLSNIPKPTNDCAMEIVAVPQIFIDQLIAKQKEKGHVGKQYFVIAQSLAEAIEINEKDEVVKWYVVE